MAANFFTNENPQSVQNTTGNYGILPAGIDPTKIEDGLTDRGADLGKLGSSMPSPMARLYLFSAALREVNSYEGLTPRVGHSGILNAITGAVETTPYHDLVGELLDMLEFVFQYGDGPDFHVVTWNVGTDCDVLDKSSAHKLLSSALRSAFGYGALKDNQSVHLFLWKDYVIGGTSPVSLVYTSANLRTVLRKISKDFTGDAGNVLFADGAKPLHERSAVFREYLYRLLVTDMKNVDGSSSLFELKKYIQDSATNYDPDIKKNIDVAPDDFKTAKILTSQGGNIKVGPVQLRVSDHKAGMNLATSDYIIKPTSDVYKHGKNDAKLPLILTAHGVDGFKYVSGRPWNETSDVIPKVLDKDINNRHLPGFPSVQYPYLTVDDFFEERVIEVSYEINKDKFFTGCAQEIKFLLPLKKMFFEYFKLSDLVDDTGKYTDMVSMKYDEQRMTLAVELKVPLANGKFIVLFKKYDVSDGSSVKVNCFDGGNTFDFAFFPFYRLEPDTSGNVYNVMIGASAKGVSLKFYEPKNEQGNGEVPDEIGHRTSKSGKSSLLTDHIRVNGAFSFCELNIDGTGTNALIIPLFTPVNSDASKTVNKFTFSIDFGTTNTHVAYAKSLPGQPVGKSQIQPFSYSDADTQMVMFNNRSGVAEFGFFTTAVKRELVPMEIGTKPANRSETPVKFPMRTATYQVEGSPSRLEMFFNSNIGFNYDADLSQSGNYKTNIKWERFDSLAKSRMSTFFAQMLWMMKNKSVQNGGSDKFDIVITYPISMRRSDYAEFKNAWDKAKKELKCDGVKLIYRTESVAPFYSYLTDLNYGAPYANMDIGGGTTDILYVNPRNHDDHVFSAFFAANDLWNDGIFQASSANKDNGFVSYYKNNILPNIHGENIQGVIDNASSSADIISYLFANDGKTLFSDNISSVMIQLPIIHFTALTFYMAYSLNIADVDVPKNLSFTGMGSKYINLISKSGDDISDIVNAVFHYAGKIFGNDKLKKASVKVNFADEPKEVTAMGALISLNHRNPINPSQDTYFGYEEEDPGRSLRYSDIDHNVLDSVIKLFMKFIEMLEDPDFTNVLGKVGHGIDLKVIDSLRSYAETSLQGMKDMSFDGQSPTDTFNEPMFFWPLKNSLYVIGKEMGNNG